MPVRVNLDRVLLERRMSLTELSDRVGVTIANLMGQYGVQTLLVDRSEANPGYVNLSLGKQKWLMKPVLSATGAIRLEDVRGQALLVQILTKSMVLDTKSGKRMVDACVHEVQRKAEADLAAQPARASIFDAPR